MAIDVICGQCQHRMRVAEEHAGKKVRCKGCSQPVRVPTLAPLADVPPHLPPAGSPLPPPLPVPPVPPMPRKAAALEDLDDLPAGPAWPDRTRTLWREPRVRLGVIGVVSLLLVVILFGLFSGGSKSTETGGSSGGGSGGGGAPVADNGSGNQKQGGGQSEEKPDPVTTTEAAEAAAVLPPPPPPFKHADLAQQAARGSATERNTALTKLGEAGAEARPAADVLCEAILSKETREAALLALEKVHPGLYKPVLALVVDNNAWNHQQASQQIAALHRDGAAAVPVLVWHLTLAARVNDPQHPFYNNVENLVGEDLSALAAIAPRSPGVVKLLIEHTRFQRADGKPGATVRQKAIDGLGSIAFEFPEHRDAIVLVLIPALIDPDLQKNALAAAARCSTRSAPLKPVLQKLKLNPEATVRQAADEALKEIELRVEFVPQLNKVGIKEGLIPHPLFEWAYNLVSGKAPLDTAVPQLTPVVAAPPKPEDRPGEGEAAATNPYVLYTYLCLCRLADSPARKQAEVRKLALERVIPIGAKEPRYRKYIAPTLVATLSDPTCAELAVNGLAQLGAEGMRVFQAAKSPAAKAAHGRMETVLLTRMKELPAEAREETFLALAALDACSYSTVQVALEALAARSTDRVSQAAALVLENHPTQCLSQIVTIYQLLQNGQDMTVTQRLRKTLEKQGLDTSSNLKFWASVVANPKHPYVPRAHAAKWLWKMASSVKALNNPDVWQGLRISLTDVARAESGNNKNEAREIAVFLATEFGAAAKEVTPVFCDWIEEFIASKYFIPDQIENAVLALEKIGPEAGPRAKASLEKLQAAPLTFLDRPAQRGRLTDLPGTGRKQALRDLCRRVLNKWEGKVVQAPPAAQPPDAPAGAVLLFNGQNLDGWELRYRNPLDQSWEVEPVGQVLIVRGSQSMGRLQTRQAYRDFTLRLEFRFLADRQLTPQGSGVLVRCTDSTPNAPFPGIECQIAEKTTGEIFAFDSKESLTPKGANQPQRHILKLKDAVRPKGEWNQYEIQCSGTTLRVTLNGVLVNEATGLPLRAGPIALMDQNNYVEFRNISIMVQGGEK